MAKYTQQGFSDFSKGTFGNGGQNLYVSRKGVLQRIFNFDTNGNGCFDIMITNSHDYNEKPRLLMISDAASETPQFREILTDGAHAAAAADLNGDGYDDLVIVSRNNGHLSDLAAFVYYGGPDGIVENHKVELSAPGCVSVACGDFNGDGLCDIAFAIEGGLLRIYTQEKEGFFRDGYRDIPLDVTHLAPADLDGDGYVDLYCRIRNGDWVVLWGGPDGIDPQRRTLIGGPTDDSCFETLPFGGGNLRYEEQARPKVLTVGGEYRLLYCAKEYAAFYSIDSQTRAARLSFVLPVRGVISGCSGDVNADGMEELALLCRPPMGAETLLILPWKENGYALEDAVSRPVSNPRDVLICDFSGNGCGDIAVCQGRNLERYTTESLLFLSDTSGIAQMPRTFVTHNAVGVLTANTARKGTELLFVNQQQSNTYGHVPAYIYLGDENGWSAERRVELPGHSPSSILPADLDDDGYADVFLVNNGEDQPQLALPDYIYHGGPNGLDPTRRTAVPTYLTWGAQIADINRDGYLDIITTSSNQQPGLNRNEITIFYGSENGYSLERAEHIEIAPQYDMVGLIWFAVGDLNGDGWLDLIVPVSNRTYSLILWGGPEGYSLERSQRLPIERALTVRVADLNGNGYPDLIFGTRASTIRNKTQEGSVVIFWGGPDGYDISRCCELPSYQCNNITIADLNNDGYLDIFVSSYFNSRERDVNSFIYWNDKGSFSVTNRKRIFSHSSSASLACDLNEDGYVDLIVAGHRAYGSHRTDVAIWWNGPEGFREENRSFLPCLGPHVLVSVDLGNQLDRGPEEFFVSAPVDLGAVQTVSGIAWEAAIPGKTWVHATLRAADTLEDLKQIPFVGPDQTEKSYYENQAAVHGIRGRYVQYRLALGAINNIGTPRITSVTLETAPQN